jgi:glycosyltransferase involved in cell wall biosynthesis
LPPFSLVTLSFNQAAFLEQAMASVAAQDYPDIEYILVDPGSTDGSRQLIERFDLLPVRRIFSPDSGPAEGLNKGFAQSTGQILGFLNADDYLLPGALQAVVSEFRRQPEVDVVSGHCLVVNEAGRVLRRSFSDPFDLTAFAYGACVLMQPSTFFRRRIFLAAGGFNPDNRSAWDGELIAQMARAGGRFALLERDLSAFRVHPGSISGSRRLDADIVAYQERMFRLIRGRGRRRYDTLLAGAYLLAKYARRPGKLWERLRRGPVYGRFGGEQ